MKPPIVIAYGLGVDSTALLVGLYLRGIRPDLILSRSESDMSRKAPTKKLCSGLCGKLLELSCFSRHGTTRDRLQQWCKSCMAENLKTYRAKRKADGRVSDGYMSRWRLRVRVLKHYGGENPRCACCGEDKYEFLAIDHINGGGGRHRKSIVAGFYEWLVKTGFPSGFRVLCHNCNTAIGLFGSCPHVTGGRGFSPPPRLSGTVRAKILAAAIELSAAGQYPSTPEVAKVSRATEAIVHKYRTLLMSTGEWPDCEKAAATNKKYRPDLYPTASSKGH